MDSLVSTQWLADHLGNEGLVVLDATRHLPAADRNALAEFRTGHIPGARFLDLAALAQPNSPVGATLPGPDRAVAVLAELGLERDDRIVIYDDSDVKTSSRAWLILRGYGFGSLAILDGGLAKWKAEGRALDSGDAPAKPTELKAQTFHEAVRRKEDMLANLDRQAEQVVDARDAGRFTGETVDTVHDLPGGHIPGARNVFFRDLFASDGTFLSPVDLRLLFEGAGIDLSQPIVTTCGSGVTASVLLFALHLISAPQTALYDGSWSEWGADPATPKATGAA